MDVNNINPILNAFTEILPQLGLEKVERKDLSLAKSTLKNDGIAVNIGVVGTLKGAIIIEMSLDSAKAIASKMMMGMEVPEFDAMAQSAISEMGNMICANACTNFAKVGITGLNISPPTLMIGDGDVVLFAPATIVVNFLVDNIPIKVAVGLYSG